MNAYELDIDRIKRRRAVADAILAQSMQPMGDTQMVNGVAVRRSPLEGFAKIAQALSAKALGSQTDADQRALLERQSTDMVSALDEYNKARTARPSSSEQIMDEQANGGEGALSTITAPPYEPSRADIRSAGMNAMAKMGGDARGVLMAQIANDMTLKAYKPGDVLYQDGKQVGAIPAKPTEHVIEGKVYQTGADGLKEVGGPGKAVDYNKPFLPGGKPNPAYQEYARNTARAGAAQMTQKVNSYLPASEEAQRDFIKSTRTTYDQLKQAPVALQSIESAKALVPEARGFMGPGGETLLEAAKFLNNRIGTDIKTEGVKSAEELRTRIFFNILDNLKKMDAQPSQQQQQIMQEALGKLGTDPNALPRVLDAFAEVMKGKVVLHNAEVQSAIDRGVKFPYDPIINIPQGSGKAYSGPDRRGLPSTDAINAELRRRAGGG